MTDLTDKEQTFVGAVSRRGIPTAWACPARAVGIDFDDHAACQQGFVGKVAVQFSKGPRGCMPIGFPLLRASILASLAFRSLSNVCQLFQAYEALWVAFHDALADHVVAILFQPSLSSTNGHKPSCSGASAFVLQPLSQPCIVVSLGSYLFARVEGCLLLGIRGYSQIALPDIDTDHSLVGFGCRFCHV